MQRNKVVLKRLFGMTVTLIILMMMSGISLAQDGGSEFGDLPPAPEATQLLAFMVGDWDVVLRERIGDGVDGEGEWEESMSAATVEWVIDGYALAESWVGEINGEASASRTFYAYNDGARRWSIARADTVWGGIFTYGGNEDGDDLLIDVQTFGAPRHRFVITDMSGDSFTVQMMAPPPSGRGLQVVWERLYSRHADDEDFALMYDTLPLSDAIGVFDFYIGEWDIAFRHQPSDDDILLETAAYASVESVLGGMAIEEHWYGQMFNENTQAYTLIIHNPNEERFETVWWDTHHYLFTTSHGDCNEQGCSLTNDIQYFDISDDSFEWNFTYSAPHDWRMIYTRRVDTDRVIE
jgi:hypothetical protein